MVELKKERNVSSIVELYKNEPNSLKVESKEIYKTRQASIWNRRGNLQGASIKAITA